MDDLHTRDDDLDTYKSKSMDQKRFVNTSGMDIASKVLIMISCVYGCKVNCDGGLFFVV